MQLSTAARRRGLVLLLADTFLMFCGFFMVIPLVAIHYIDKLGFAAATVGLALALRQMIQQGTTVLSGMLADRFGVRGLIAGGVLIRTVGFVSLGFATSAPALFLAMLLSAVGGALFDSPSRAAIAALTTPENRARVYSLNGVASGLGMTVGPLVGALLIRLDFLLVCIAAAGCFALIFLLTLLALPSIEVATERQGVGYGFSLVLHDRPFLLLILLLNGYWFMWVQITISIPLVAERLSGSSDGVGIVYALNAGLSVVLQYPLIRLLGRWLSQRTILVIGVMLMALGLGAVAVVSSFAGLLVCVVIFALGSLLSAPSQQTVTAELSDPRALGSYFGFSSLALALGGGLGNLSGGLLSDLARNEGLAALPWLTFSAIGIVSALGLALIFGAGRQRPVPGDAQSVVKIPLANPQ